jgi:hypothetical protein
VGWRGVFIDSIKPCLKLNESATKLSPCAPKRKDGTWFRLSWRGTLRVTLKSMKNVFICTRCIKLVGFLVIFNVTKNFDERSIILDEFDP